MKNIYLLLFFILFLMCFVFVFFIQGRAGTQSPTTTNYTVEFPTFGETSGVSTSRVQWTSLALGKPPSWSWYFPCQVSINVLCFNFSHSSLWMTNKCTCYDNKIHSFMFPDFQLPYKYILKERYKIKSTSNKQNITLKEHPTQ